MTGLWRPLSLAAVVAVVLGAGVADAQTVIVRNAPPGSTIELAFNAETVASTTADPTGQATVAFKNALEIPRDVRVDVDVCPKVRRVILVERYGQAPMPGEGCDRKEIVGFFVLQKVTTFVLDLGGATPMVWLRQGKAPGNWLTESAEETSSKPGRSWRPSPRGLMLGGAGGVTTFRDITAIACGSAEQCSGPNYDFSYTVNVDFWLTNFLGVEGSFIRPASFNVTGSGPGYRFTTNFNPYLWTILGKGGVPIGPIRPYGMAGLNYHRATSATTNTIEDRTVTTDSGTVTVPGGIQTYDLQTTGWGWLFGGGLEAWVTRRAAIYGEISRAQVKGSSSEGSFPINDRVTVILVGARVNIWP